jgi:hypothetical protein
MNLVPAERCHANEFEKKVTHLHGLTLVVTMCTFLLSSMSVTTDLAASKMPHASMPSSNSMYFGGPPPVRLG